MDDNMKFRWDNKYFKWGLTAFFVIAASICFYYLMFHGSQIKETFSVIINLLMPVMFGFVTAYLMTPVLNYIEYYALIPLCNKLKIKDSQKRSSIIRYIGIFLTTCIFVAIIYSLIAMMLSQIVPSVVNIISNFDDYYNNFIKWINQVLENNPEMGEYIIRMLNDYSVELESWLNDTVLTKATALLKTVSLSVISVLKVLWNFVIGFIISVYLMTGKEKFSGQAKKVVYAAFERDTANTVISSFRFTHKTFIGFIGGKMVDSLIIGMLCFIGTTLLGTPYAALVSLVVGVTNVVPFFGPFLGAIPSIILIFVVDPLNPLNCVYFAIFVLALQQFDGNILGPKILGDSTGLSSFWVIFAITLFGGLWGIPGMIVGVPLFAVIYAAIKAAVVSSLKKKKMPDDTKEYIDLGYVDDDGYHEYIPEYKQKKNKNDNIKKSRRQEKSDAKMKGGASQKDDVIPKDEAEDK